MKSFFAPNSIAVAGISADPDKLGSIIFTNLLENRKNGLLKASVFGLNPAYDRIGNEPCYPDIKSLPETPDLLIVAVPESLTLGLIKEAAKAGVKAAIIIAAGYAEIGKVEVEAEIKKVASKHGMRIMGPNTIGVVDPWSGVDSLFLRPTKKLPGGGSVASMLKPLKGEIAMVSQSGYLSQAFAEELAANGVGVRALVGTGNQLDVSVEDVIQYFADDQHTKVIAVYLEGVRDGRKFMEATSYASERKPVVVYKVGKSDVGARAALTHTASMVGDYDVYRAAFRQTRVVEAGSLQELVDFAMALLMLPRRSGNRLAVLTNAGGVGAVAADEAQRVGLLVERLDAPSQRRLRSVVEGAGFVPNSSFLNPIDVTATAPTADFARIAEAMMELPEVDAGIILPTHQTPAIGPEVATLLAPALLKSGKPVCACVLGNSELAAKIHREFLANGIPSFPTPERAVRALAALVIYSTSSKEWEPRVSHGRPARFRVRRGALPPRDVGALLRAYGITEPKSIVVKSAIEIERLGRFGFPVACKLLSPTVVHKTDVGGVALNVRDRDEAARAFARFQKLASRHHVRFDGMLVQEMIEGGVELLLGGTRDVIFGPTVVLGLGGTYTELIRERAVAVAPLTEQEVRRIMITERMSQVLGGYRRGQKASVGRLCKVVSDFSRIMVDNPSIGQMEINPLIVTKDTAVAVDARVVLQS